MNKLTKKLTTIITISIMFALTLSACGNSDEAAMSEEAAYEYADYGYTNGAGLNTQKSSSYDDGYMADEAVEEYYDEDSYIEQDLSNNDYADASATASSDTSDEALTDASNRKTSAESKGVINTEMLVYTCNVAIRTEKFDVSYDMLKNLINDMNGFIESEDYSESDSSYSSSKIAHLTVRVPSSNYNSFLDSFGDIGTVVNKSSNAQNVSQEYSDTEKALEIYEAELARYIERIKTIKDESTLMELESKITELQIKVAQLKSRRSQIETDVAYSYVYITLSESIYKEETETSFGGRFLNTLNRSLHGFLDMCEGLLFFIVLVLPEVVVIFIIVLIIVKLVKRKKRNKKEKKKKKDTVADAVSDSDSSSDALADASADTPDEQPGNSIDKKV